MPNINIAISRIKRILPAILLIALSLFKINAYAAVGSCVVDNTNQRNLQPAAGQQLLVNYSSTVNDTLTISVTINGVSTSTVVFIVAGATNSIYVNEPIVPAGYYNMTVTCTPTVGVAVSSTVPVSVQNVLVNFIPSSTTVNPGGSLTLAANYNFQTATPTINFEYSTNGFLTSTAIGSVNTPYNVNGSVVWPNIAAGTYDVRACVRDIWLNCSVPVTVTSVATPPVAPTGVAATQGTLAGYSVGLNWLPSANATSYSVYSAATATGIPALVASGITATSYTATVTTPAVMFYLISAANTAGASGLSAPTSGYPNPAPTSVSASGTTTSGVAVNMTPTVVDASVIDTFTYAIGTPVPLNGIATVAGSVITYTPNATFVGTESFGIKVIDKAGSSVTGSATVTVNPVVLGAPTGIVATQGTVSNGVTISWAAVTGAASYKVYMASTAMGAKTLISPAGNVIGTSFTYSTTSPAVTYFFVTSISSTGGESVFPVGVTGFANPAPTAVSGTATTMATVPVTITPAVTDASVIDSWTYALVTPPLNGTVTITNNVISYVSTATFTGPATFTISAKDTAGGTVNGTVTVTVTPYILPAPTAVTATQGTVSNGVTITWPVVTGAASYKVYLASTATGAKTLISPAGNIVGSSFTYATTSPVVTYFFVTSVSSSGGESAFTTGVTGFANPAPTAVSGTATTMATVPVTITPVVTDASPVDSWTYALVSLPLNGTVTVSTANVISYVSNATFTGIDTFTISAKDTAGGVVNGTVAVTVTPLVLAAPTGVIATQGSLSNAVGINWSAVTGAASYNVYVAPTLTGVKTKIATATTALTFTYPSTNPAVQIFFVEAVSASNGTSMSAGVSGYANNPPTSATATGSTVPGGILDMTPLVVDTTPNDSWTYLINTQGTQGVASVINGKLHYVANATFSGNDSFTFRATDIAGGSVIGTATITPGILPAPTGLTAGQGTNNTGIQLNWTAVTGAASYNVYTATSLTGAQTLVASGITAPSYLALTTNPAIQYYFVTAVWNLTSESPKSAGAGGYINLPPTSSAVTITLPAQNNVSVTPAVVDPNPNEVFTFSAPSKPTFGTAAVVNNLIIYTSTNPCVASDSFTYTVTDKGGSTVVGTATVTGNCSAPTFTLGGFKETAAGNGIMVDMNGASPFAGLTVNSAPAGLVNITLTNGTSVLTTNNVGVNAVTPLTNAPGQTLWAQQAIKIRVAYASNPSVFTENTYQVVTVPNTNGMQIAMSGFPASIVDTATLAGTASIGISSLTGLTFNSAVNGTWNIRFVEASNTTALVDLIAPSVLSTGTLNVAGVSPKGYTTMKLVAMATLVSPITTYSVSVQSVPFNVTVLSGAALSGVISAPSVGGATPLSQIYTLTLNAISQANLGQVQWFTSLNGAAYTLVPNTNNLNTPSFTLPSAGNWNVKATLTNKNSGVTSDTNILAIVLADTPTVTITGPSSTMFGTAVNLTAATAVNNAPITNAIVDWYYVDNSKPTGYTYIASGYNISFAPPANIAYVIEARAKMSATAINYGKAVLQLQSMSNGTTSNIVSGSKYIEVGTINSYTGVVTPPWISATSAMAVSSEWQLPNGTITAGLNLSWTPTATDVGVQKLIFRSWVNGFKATTFSETPYYVTVWQYVWPKWSIGMSSSNQFIPSTITLALNPDNSALLPMLNNAGLTFKWNLPVNIAGSAANGNSITGSVTQAGTYNVSGVVSDNRGNSSTVNYSFSIAATPTPTTNAPPVTIATSGTPATTTVAASGTPATTPVGGGVNPGGAPACTLVAADDKRRKTIFFTYTCNVPNNGYVTNYQWTVNGTVSNATGLFTSFFYEGLPPTPLNVTAAATSNTGQTASTTVAVSTP